MDLNITSCSEQEINTFVAALQKAGQEMGMIMGQPLFIRPSNLGELESTMKMAKQKFTQLQIIFVIINRKGDPAYEIVKRVGDLDLHITTQCIEQKNVTGRGGPGRGGPDGSTMANICLKLNAKLGGVNNLIARDFRPKVLLNEQVIIMGVDVTLERISKIPESHPSPLLLEVSILELHSIAVKSVYRSRSKNTLKTWKAWFTTCCANSTK